MFQPEFSFELLSSMSPKVNKAAKKSKFKKCKYISR